jgi:hypothetical protein
MADDVEETRWSGQRRNAMFTWTKLFVLVGVSLCVFFVGAGRAHGLKAGGHERVAVSGTVVDSSGNPVEGAIVHVQRPEGLQGPTTKPSENGGVKTAPKHEPITTDASGKFTLPHVKIGNATIVAVKRGIGKGETSVDVTAAGVSNVTITLQPKAGDK